MAIASGGVGTVAAAAAQNVSPPYPASIAAGDGLVLVRTAKPDTTVFVTPDGWTLLHEVAGGLGVFGNDTGPLRAAAYWREADGAETGTLVCSTSPGTHDVQQAFIARWTTDSGAEWDVAASGGVDAIQSNDWTIVADPALALAAGDVVEVALAWPTDSARTWSSEALTASGATITGLLVPLAGVGSGLGADMATRAHAFTVTDGTSTAGPTYVGQVNSATNVTGPTVIVRLREASPGGDVEGHLAVTLPAFSSAVAGNARAAASVSVTVPSFEASVSAAALSVAVLAAVTPAVGFDGSGAARNAAVLDVALAALTTDLGEPSGAVVPGIHAPGTSRATLTPGRTRPTLTANTSRG